MLSEVRTIAGVGHTIAYAWDDADRLTEVTYPSGRQVAYFRDGEGRITSVATRNVSTDPWSNVATGLTYQPFTRLVQNFTYGNGLNDWHTFDQDHRLDVLGVYDTGAQVINRAHTRTDNLNLTNIWDNVDASKNQSFWYSDANRLQNSSGPWGDLTFYHDGVGNRTHRILDDGSSVTTQVFGYTGINNLLQDVTTNGTITRTFTRDVRGNLTSDTLTGAGARTNVYTHNQANRLKTVTVDGNLRATYTYNAAEQLAIRVLTNQTPSGTIHNIYDIAGNLIAETDGNGNAVREYIWLPLADQPSDRPLAVISDANTPSAATYYVHVDHLQRPIAMSDSARALVWQATWLPFGGAHAITGSATLDARFPGQWFQIESGLSYNWHRHYDPTTGRYTQADPLGLVDGPSVYGYAVGNPVMYTDPDGLETVVIVGHPTRGNPFGHVSIGFPATNESYSFGTGKDVQTPLDDFLDRQNSYRDSTVYFLPTTPKQESCIASCLSGFPAALPGVSLRDNCATRSNTCLHRCGIGKPGQTVGYPLSTQSFARRRATSSVRFHRRNQSSR